MVTSSPSSFFMVASSPLSALMMMDASAVPSCSSCCFRGRLAALPVAALPALPARVDSWIPMCGNPWLQYASNGFRP